MDKLLDYINNIKSIPQHSEEWYKIRSGTIGGSEIQYIINGNYNSLIEKKLKPNMFIGNIHTKWGNLFEEVSRMFMVKLIKNDIYEIGSVDGFVEKQRYSPDGLSVYEDDIILFEFKNPTVSLPNGIIPSHYMFQVQAGLASIPITNYALFVNSSYRRCKFSDISFNSTKHNPDIHKEEIKNNKIYACGVILFQIEKEMMELIRNDENYNQDFSHLIDYKDYGKENLNLILNAISSKIVKPIYKPIILNKQLINKEFEYKIEEEIDDPKSCIRKQISETEEENIVGYLCYKLLIVNIIKIEKNNEIIKNMEYHLKKAVELLP